MLWKNIGYLLEEITGVNELYRSKIEYKETKVFCNIKSIGQNEFYQASIAGFKPEIKVEIKCINLNDNITHFKLKDKIYKILRTYKKEYIIELVLTAMVIDNE